MQNLAHLFPQGWKHFLYGGILIGAGVSLLFALTGLIGGVTRIYGSMLSFVSGRFRTRTFRWTRSWQMMYALGLVLGAIAFTFSLGHGHTFVTHVPLWQLFVGGVMGGFGARLSGGCTSGHGICGIGSAQLPSILAVVIFLTTAILTANAVHALGGF